jgi:glycosyltransferase involved in cell wall biosynthesis
VIVHVPRRWAPSHWGGTESYLAALAAGLGTPQRLITTTALCAEPSGDCAGVPVERHPYFYPVWRLDPGLAARWDASGGNLVSGGVAAAISRLPDLRLVHLHTGNRLGAQAMLAARKRGVPTVLTLHGGYFTIPAAERASLAGGGRKRGWEWGRFLSLLLGTRRLLSRVDAIVCVGPAEFAAVREHLPQQRVRLIPGGVEVARWTNGDGAAARARLGLGAGPVLAAIGRIDHQKDPATLVRAWLRLPTPRPHLVLAGAETEPGLGAELRALAADAPGLVLAGQLPQAELADLLATATVMVLPSRHEPFGISILEAWAAGRGVIAADSDGPRHLLADGAAGALFPVGDDVALAGLLTSALADPARATAWGAAARAQAQDHTWTTRIAAHRALYAELGVACG